MQLNLNFHTKSKHVDKLNVIKKIKFQKKKLVY